ncbi:MAG: tyrosine--tRNA ligase [Thermoplasmatota archaeon]
MSIEERLRLIREVGEEIVTEDELKALLESKAHPIAYDGFEPSGTAHIAQGVMRAINVNKMTRTGVRFKMFVADWHAWANNKMGGDLEKIQTTGKYLIEIWRATGMDLSKVDFVWASEFMADEAYWKKVMNIARDSSLDRILRTTQIMGRSEKDKLSAAQILYPCMQAADIFHLEADITQLGMDQRKVNMLAREVGPKLGLWKPVVVSHHMLMGLAQPPSLPRSRKEFADLELKRAVQSLAATASQLGHPAEWPMNHLQALLRSVEHATSPSEVSVHLRTAMTSLNSEWENHPEHADGPAADLGKEYALYLKIFESYRSAADIAARVSERWDSIVVERATAMKMSKSNPDSAIFMTDTAEQVAAKMKKAYCPEKRADENPVLEYYRYIIFERFPEVRIDRPAKFGGDLEFKSYTDLEAAFVSGALHPADAKSGAAKYINQLLDPVREHFVKNEKAAELKRQVESFKVTR